MERNLSPAEREAVEQHKYFLSEKAGHDVGFASALEDWLANQAERWRAERNARLLAKQRDEIMRYKWIESEKANYDLGRMAALDWVKKYAAVWRSWYDTEYDPEDA